MFLQKIEKLAQDWSVEVAALEAVARESMLYGMRLTRHPSALKRELKKVKIDSKLARPLWSGNAYLLITFPEVLCNKKKKIPCLEDFLFARRVLSKEQRALLQERLDQYCKIPREELLVAMVRSAKKEAYHGRFIPQFDQMNESLKDVEQDLIVRALEILNKEMTNFKTESREGIDIYLSYCLGKKAATYLSENSPKGIKARIEPEDFDRVIHQGQVQALDREGGVPLCPFLEADFKKDLHSVLPEKIYRGVALLMNFADVKDTHHFEKFLLEKNIKAQWLTQAQMKKHIEKFLGYPVFEKVHETTLREFLIRRMHQEEGFNEVVSRDAYCEGL